MTRTTSLRNGDDVVTLGRYAKALGISRTLAYVQARSGEIPVRWRGGRYEMTKADFERLMATRRGDPTPAA
jgi:predicted site-specific integrase-resolvase